MTSAARKSRPAFSLVEMLAASAIAVMLFVVAIRVSAVFRRDQDATTRGDSPLVLQIASRDLEQAVAHEWAGQELHIVTTVAARRDTPAGPASVVYHTTDRDGRRWLLRSTRNLTDPNARWDTDILDFSDESEQRDHLAVLRTLVTTYAPPEPANEGREE